MGVFQMFDQVRWADSGHELTSLSISHWLTDWMALRDVYAFDGNIYVFGR